MRALVFALFGVLASLPTLAAELVVFAPTPFAPVLRDLASGFEARTGNHVTVVRDTAGGLARRIAAGEHFDLALVNAGVVTDLRTQGKIQAGSDRPVAKSGVGVAMKEGAVKPDISTVAAFKATMLAAQAVAFTDPAAGGSSGIYIANLFERLGIADAMRPKSVLVKGGLSAEQVVTGRATLAIQQIPELLVVPGATYVGPLPAEIQNITLYTAVFPPSGPHEAAAKTYLADLLGPEGARSSRAHGLDPQ